MNRSAVSAMRCFRCKGIDIVIDPTRGDTICRECGEVLGERIMEQTSEWRIFADDDRNRGESMVRCSTDTRESSWPSQTVFVGGGSEELKSSLKKTQGLSEDKQKMKAAASIGDVYQIASSLKLTSKITSRACDLFTRAIAEKLYKKKNKVCLAAASIYLSCRIEGFARLFIEISDVCACSSSDINSLQATMARAFSLEFQKIKCESIVTRLAMKLMLNPKVTELCRQTCGALESTSLLEDWSPNKLAASSIMLTLAACRASSDPKLFHVHLDSHNLSVLTDLSIPLLRRTYESLLPHVFTHVPRHLAHLMQQEDGVQGKCVSWPQFSVLESRKRSRTSSLSIQDSSKKVLVS